MNGTESPDPQKASNANTNGSNSNNSSLAAKKRKKDLKPIITMEGAPTSEPALDRTHALLSLFLVIGENRWGFSKSRVHAIQISKAGRQLDGTALHHPTQDSEG
ncbi:hypothetical protein FGRMN_10121 [Fusarium graminum]|nr:hypothetical protein FGRMN_10121 [Fusarium graminum]